MHRPLTRAACLILLVALPATAQVVPYERVVQAEDEPASWLTYSGNYASHRFSPLDQIDRDNVGDLRPAWVHQIPTDGLIETTPLVVDGVMYISEPGSNVAALDARSGRLLWRWERPLPRDLRLIGFPPVNRGVAILDDRVFVGTLDGALVALDAGSGSVRWETQVADNATGHSITLAPLAIDGKVIVGISFALDADTGAPLWSFYAGLPTRTNPMSYEIDGTQYVVMSAGTALFAFALP